MSKFIVVSPDEAVGLAGFDSHDDFIDNIRCQIAELHGQATMVRELRRLRGTPGWKDTAGPDVNVINSHQRIIDWSREAHPGDMYKEGPLGRRIFCLSDSVGDVRYL